MDGIDITYNPSCDPQTITLLFPFYIKVDDHTFFKAKEDRLVVITDTKTEVFWVDIVHDTVQDLINEKFDGVNLKEQQIEEAQFKYYINRNNTYFTN